jgi:hypothetical protein
VSAARADRGAFKAASKGKASALRTTSRRCTTTVLSR